MSANSDYQMLLVEVNRLMKRLEMKREPSPASSTTSAAPLSRPTTPASSNPSATATVVTALVATVEVDDHASSDTSSVTERHSTPLIEVDDHYHAPMSMHRTFEWEAPTSSPTTKTTTNTTTTTTTTTTEGFSVMTYNVLADELATSKAMPYASAASLAWLARLDKIVHAVAQVRPTILCMQEVQVSSNPSKHHYTAIASRLAPLGYHGKLLTKSRSRPDHDIGIAVFWTDAFVLLDKLNVYFATDLERRCPRGSPVYKFFVFQPQTALLLALRHVATGRIVIVCNTHISCAFETPSKQFAQVMVCLRQLERFQKHVARTYGTTTLPDVVFTGDFNSQPTSAMYEVVTRGTVSRRHVDFKSVGNEDPPFSKLAHPLQLSSAYSTIHHTEPVATNVKDMFCGTLDYVFYGHTLTATRVLALPLWQACRTERGLPDSIHPSDHLPLAAYFEFR